MSNKSDRGRPTAKAPVGRVTLQQAADIAGVSYSTAYRRIVSESIPHDRGEDGTISILRSDARKIRARKADPEGRPAYMVRPDPSTDKGFKIAAKAAGDVPVSRWLLDLGLAELARLARKSVQK